MFIKISPYLIPIDRINWIKRVGEGLVIDMNDDTISISNVSDEELSLIEARLCGFFAEEGSEEEK